MGNNSIPDSFYAELHQLDDLGDVGAALARYVRALDPRGSFEREGGRWVNRPDNFLTLTIHHKRAMNIVLTLRGHTLTYKEPAQEAGLGDDWVRDLERDRASYSRYRITKAAQLLPAAYFIRVAFEYRSRGRKESG